MTNVFTRKLELFGPLSEEDRKVLGSIVRHPIRYPGGTVIIHEGDNPEVVLLVLEGLLYRSKTSKMAVG